MAEEWNDCIIGIRQLARTPGARLTRIDGQRTDIFGRGLQHLAIMNEALPHQSPAETTLLDAGNSSSQYLRGVIGKRDLTLHPMIPAGSMVQIDTWKREISRNEDCTHEFQRSIYFLKTRDGYFCGWCELDADLQWLTLVPHPLSPVSSRGWNPTEIENLGRVVAVTTPPGRRV